MLVTPDFVLINMPMTGATVVADMLRVVYGEHAMEMGRKHAPCAEIPDAVRGKPMLSVFRSPFERYVSQYHYGCWRSDLDKYCAKAMIQQDYPSYPDVTFKAFVRIANRFFAQAQPQNCSDMNGSHRESGPGWHVQQHVQWFCRDPSKTLNLLATTDVSAEMLAAFEYPIHFLHASSLQSGVLTYLRSLGVPDRVLRRVGTFSIQSHDRSHELRLRRDAKKYYDPDLTDYLLRRERLLFERFPQSEREAT